MNDILPYEILIVDDTPANLRLLSQILTEHGYKVRAVTSGARALDSAQASPPSLILLDIRMPGLNGFDVCTRLKANLLTADIPVIFISALDDVQDKVRAFHMGGVDYITKPFQIDEILARTETHLALRKMHQQLVEANRRYERELEIAGRIQSSFLPRSIPTIPGWDIAAKLVPARETSGDFYDFIPLDDGKCAIVVADVVDKGAGAALFMALSWSLIRTYIVSNPSDPARAFELVNQRILQDTYANQFVTVFLGVFNPNDWTLTYVNAGHCPALYFRKNGSISQLKTIGIPLGLEDVSWNQEVIHIGKEDLLLVYTDGVIEAQNPSGQLYQNDRLIKIVQSCLDRNPSEIFDEILADIIFYIQKDHLEDDLAMVILKGC